MTEIEKLTAERDALQSQLAEAQETIELQWAEREEPLKQAQLYMSECNRLEKERNTLQSQLECATQLGNDLEQQRDELRGQLAAPTAQELEIHDAKCPALTGEVCTCDRHNPTVDSAWAQFCAGIGDGPKAPYPGMIGAFERYYGQSFADKDWRKEASVWAAAWKAALYAAPTAQEPVNQMLLDALKTVVANAPEPYCAITRAVDAQCRAAITAAGERSDNAQSAEGAGE